MLGFRVTIAVRPETETAYSQGFVVGDKERGDFSISGPGTVCIIYGVRGNYAPQLTITQTYNALSHL